MQVDKPKILIVDDFPAIVTLIRHKLLQKGYHVITAQNGEDALSLARNEYPDLIISDVDMPLMTGYELCSKVKKDSRLNSIPVILLTSLQNTENIMKGIEAGADNYLTKPFDDHSLFTKVEELLENPPVKSTQEDVQKVSIEGKTYEINSDLTHLVSLLLSTYKNSLAQTRKLEQTQKSLKKANKELELTKEEYEELLSNMLPKKVAESLLAYGSVRPERYDDITIMFTDFDGFSSIVPELSPEELIESLSFYFDKFDQFSNEHSLIKIKTMGDSYMAAGGLPERNKTHAIDCCICALKMQEFVRDHGESSFSKIPHWPLRIGIHTGPAVVGVIGKNRFAYDVWGNAVNHAARMEQHGHDDAINISETTYQRVKDFFECEPMGKIEAKNMGELSMYKLVRILPDYASDDQGLDPNKIFVKAYSKLKTEEEVQE